MILQRFSGLNTIAQRKEFWETLTRENGMEWMTQALTSIDPVNAKVLTWHYVDGYSFSEITLLLQRSISIVRNHHNIGIFQLQQNLIKGQVQIKL